MKIIEKILSEMTINVSQAKINFYMYINVYRAPNKINLCISQLSNLPEIQNKKKNSEGNLLNQALIFCLVHINFNQFEWSDSFL